MCCALSVGSIVSSVSLGLNGSQLIAFVVLFRLVELVFDCVWMSLGMYEFGNQSYDILLYFCVLIALPLGFCVFVAIFL